VSVVQLYYFIFGRLNQAVGGGGGANRGLRVARVQDASFVQQKIGRLIGLQRPFLLIFCGGAGAKWIFQIERILTATA
jgi:hypothetical protein